MTHLVTIYYPALNVNQTPFALFCRLLSKSVSSLSSCLTIDDPRPAANGSGAHRRTWGEY
jgi:hypothetical protein